jgi:hypothetical protein
VFGDEIMHGGLRVSDQDENTFGSIAAWGVLAKKSFHPRRKERLSAPVRNIGELPRRGAICRMKDFHICLMHSDLHHCTSYRQKA